MMPPLHNYVTIDTAAFLAVPDRIESAYYMCKEVGTKSIDVILIVIKRLYSGCNRCWRKM